MGFTLMIFAPKDDMRWGWVGFTDGPAYLQSWLETSPHYAGTFKLDRHLALYFIL